MKFYAPKYYKDFECIASRCKHSCCVGWEIDVDEKTLEKYSGLECAYAREIKESIAKRGTPHFKLKKGDRCPHLDKDGLCKIIINLGEEYLCEICKEHPRFYNRTPKGTEVGLGLSCEEACRIILSADYYDEIVEIGEEEGCYADFDTGFQREKIFRKLKDGNRNLSDKLFEIIREYGLDKAFENGQKQRKIISSLEYLDIADKSRFLAFSSDVQIPLEFEKQTERFFAYLIYRHLPQAMDEREVKEAVGFSLFLVKLFVSILQNEQVKKAEEAFEIARIISEEIEYSQDNTDLIKASIK